MTIEMQKVILFCDESSGDFIPQRFANEIDSERTRLHNVSKSDMEILRAGPDHESYWDAWNHVAMNCKVESLTTGQMYDLYQDGDLWLIDETAQAGVDHELWNSDE
jgi:hypothetical protein